MTPPESKPGMVTPETCLFSTKVCAQARVASTPPPPPCVCMCVCVCVCVSKHSIRCDLLFLNGFTVKKKKGYTYFPRAEKKKTHVSLRCITYKSKSACFAEVPRWRQSSSSPGPTCCVFSIALNSSSLPLRPRVLRFSTCAPLPLEIKKKVRFSPFSLSSFPAKRTCK